MNGVARVLFIAPSNVGDAILALPALDLVRAELPAARITALAGRRSFAVFAARADVAEVIVDERRRSWRAPLALWQQLRLRRFGLVVDLRHTLWPLLLGVRRASPLWRRPPRALIHMGDRHLW